MVRVVVRVAVAMVRCVLFVAFDEDRKVGGGETAFRERFVFVDDAGDSEAVQLGDGGIPVGQEFQQRPGEHVAGRAHRTVEVERLHRLSFRWLMRLARNPAPKPLSMLTTLTPAAQEFSIASSAATPPNDAP